MAEMDWNGKHFFDLGILEGSTLKSKNNDATSWMGLIDDWPSFAFQSSIHLAQVVQDLLQDN